MYVRPTARNSLRRDCVFHKQKDPERVDNFVVLVELVNGGAGIGAQVFNCELGALNYVPGTWDKRYWRHESFSSLSQSGGRDTQISICKHTALQRRS